MGCIYVSCQYPITLANPLVDAVLPSGKTVKCCKTHHEEAKTFEASK